MAQAVNLMWLNVEVRIMQFFKKKRRNKSLIKAFHETLVEKSQALIEAHSQSKKLSRRPAVEKRMDMDEILGDIEQLIENDYMFL